MAVDKQLFKALVVTVGRKVAVRLADPTDQWGLVPNYTGAATTRAQVRTQVGESPTIGSLYRSTAGKVYVKVANAHAVTDWQRVATTAAD